MPEDLSRLAIHTMTHKPSSLAECCDHFAAAGVGGISVWRNVIEPIGIAEAAKIVRGSGLRVPALVRGGFFTATDAPKRQAAVDENRRILDEAASIGAEMVVLVCGATPGQSLVESRKQIEAGIARCLSHAREVGVKLAIEPLHPMYAADRSAINRMAEARHICQRLRDPILGIAVDVYHVWWDPDVESEIALAGQQGTLFAFHICDWRVETRDLLNDRGLMGEGCIDIPHLRRCAESAGFAGLHEVEIFSSEYWASDQQQYLEKIIDAYRKHV